MSETTENLKAQKAAIGKLLENEPAMINGSHNKRYYALAGKMKQLIKKLKQRESQQYKQDWLGQ